jgi:GT2 family glycosyltransferase
VQFDIVMVTYNSQKWISNCFKSIAESSYELSEIAIFVVDNQSSDNTNNLLHEAKKNYEHLFREFQVIQSGCNLGFGKANNLGSEKGSAENVFFLNIDTELCVDTLKELSLAINTANDVGIWELRQFPYEHPKYYNPVSLHTTWASGAAFVIRRDLFQKLGGFDKNIFMYAEDVDLSWRVRLEGYHVQYVPKAVVNHYSYSTSNEIKPVQYINSILNNLYLRYKFGTFKDVIKGYVLFLGLLEWHEPHKSRKFLIESFLTHFLKVSPYLRWRFKHADKLRDFRQQFLGWDYEIPRSGAFYQNEYPITNPKVSIIIRTCGRPSVLRETLISIRNQTYKNLETIVIEDGNNVSQKLIAEEFADLNIRYEATKSRVGRCVVGNLGLENATGKYCNFLDDDDLFFADHVEVLVKSFEKNPGYRVAYSLALETPIVVYSRDPYEYTEVGKTLVYNQRFNRLLLFHHNYLPIQSVMFETDIFREEAGFDESLDVLEDWDLWVRYSLKNDFLYVEKTTSLYRVPFDKSISEARTRELNDALDTLRKKHAGYTTSLSVSDVVDELDRIARQPFYNPGHDSLQRLRANHPRVFRALSISRRLVVSPLGVIFKRN